MLQGLGSSDSGRAKQCHQHTGRAVIQREPALECQHTLHVPHLLHWECRQATPQPQCPPRAMRPRSLLARVRRENIPGSPAGA